MNYSQKYRKHFIISVVIFIAISLILIVNVSKTYKDDANMMSFLGGLLGGVLGGVVTFIAIYFTVLSLKQNVMAYVVPTKTNYYIYYKSSGYFYSKKFIEDEQELRKEEDTIKEHFCFMNFANIGVESALEVNIKWSSPYDSELYDILLEYGLTNELMKERFRVHQTAILATDYILPVKVNTEKVKVQIPNELMTLFKIIIAIYKGCYADMKNDESYCFRNNFVNKVQEFATVNISYKDLNGNSSEIEHKIYCRIQNTLNTYNWEYNVIQISFSTDKNALLSS